MFPTDLVAAVGEMEDEEESPKNTASKKKDEKGVKFSTRDEDQVFVDESEYIWSRFYRHPREMSYKEMVTKVVNFEQTPHII